jgi:hypothetical protein
LFEIDQHSYSHKKVLDDSEAHWLVRRWEMYFQSCGFDPRRRQSVYMTETGCDDWGLGFPAQNTTQEEFRAWCNRFMEVGRKPLIVNGVKYESPLVGGAIFQLGGNGDPRWNKFDVAGYLDTLKEFYG